MAGTLRYMQQKKAFAKGMQFGAFWGGPKEITSNKTTCSYIAEKNDVFRDVSCSKNQATEQMQALIDRFRQHEGQC